MKRILCPVGVVIVVMLLGSASVADAQTRLGVRAGVSGSPDQFFFGGHLETRPLVQRLTFRPNLEIGIGDEETLVAINLEFAYKFPLRGHPWVLYAGAGPAAIIRDFHDGHPRAGDTDFEPGFNFLFGAEHNGGLFFEVKAGVIDSPAVKFAVGYSFR